MSLDRKILLASSVLVIVLICTLNMDVTASWY